MGLLAAPRLGASGQMVRIAWRERRRKSRARSCVTLLLRRQRLNQPLEVGRFFPRGDQCQAIGHYYYKIVNAIHGDSTAIGLHHVVAAVQHMDITARHVAELVLVAHPAKSTPGADVIPTDSPGTDRDVLAALQYARVDGNRTFDAVKEYRCVGLGINGEGFFQLA